MSYKVGDLVNLISSSSLKGSKEDEPPRALKKLWKRKRPSYEVQPEFSSGASTSFEVKAPKLKKRRCGSVISSERTKKLRKNIFDDGDMDFQCSDLKKENKELPVIPEIVSVKGNPSKKINKMLKTKSRKGKSNPAKHPDDEIKTVFVGNVSKQVTRKELKKYFQKYGKVDKVRIRSVVPVDLKTPRKAAEIKNLTNPKRKSKSAYVRFVDRESAEAALKADGKKFFGNHLKVNRVVGSEKPDANCCIFIGNLPWEAEDEDIWKIFRSCGKIQNVHLPRVPVIGSGKGVGFVNFKSEKSLAAALQLDGHAYMDRQIRVKRWSRKPKLVKKVKGKEDKTDGRLKLSKKGEKAKSAFSLEFMKMKPYGKKENKEEPVKFTGLKIIKSIKAKKSKQKLDGNDQKKLKIARILVGKEAMKPKKKVLQQAFEPANVSSTNMTQISLQSHSLHSGMVNKRIVFDDD